MAMREKEVSPILSEVHLRSTKKVRIRPDGEGGETEVLPDEMDAAMTGKESPSAVSYRSKLLSGEGSGEADRNLLEVALSDDDYTIDKEDGIPCIQFSSALRAVLSKGMERSLIVKLLGKSISYHDLISRTQVLWKLRGTYQLVDMEGGFFCATFALAEDYMKVLTGGPWMIYGAYLTVQPWFLEFDAKTSAVSRVVAWLRIPGLSFRYYHKSTLRAIGALLGEVVKIDYMTETRGRGKYARIAILVDLLKPLIPWIKVDGKTYGIEYEGLPHICFAFGKYGHTEGKCPTKEPMTIECQPQEQASGVGDGTAATKSPGSCSSPSGGQNTPEEAASPYGSWMKVQYPKKGNKSRWGKEAKIGESQINGGSRYNILFDCEDMGDPTSMAPPTQPAQSRIPMKKARNTCDSVNTNGNQGIQIGQKQPPKAGHNTSYGARAGKNVQTKQAQEYRPKVNPSAQIVSTVSKPTKDPGPSSVDLEMANDSGTTLNGGSTKGDVSNIVPGQTLEPGPAHTVSAQQFSKSPSSLDPQNHTVMILQQSRSALDGMTVGPSVSMKGEIGKGKENKMPQELQKRKAVQGHKLHSTIRRQLKAKPRTSGKSILKDAIEVLKEEFVDPTTLTVTPECSPKVLGEGGGPDDGPSSPAMAV
ncbi:hypothetical protein K1719_046117 [Acacia pycnantha]|nr:hypothetical protein K1719_046117 [Acacia pycnantha]